MLYLLRDDGHIEELPQAASAQIDPRDGSLVCYDEQGNEVARYARLTVTLYSNKPFPPRPVGNHQAT